MTYQERQCLVNIFSNFLVAAGFAVYLTAKLASTSHTSLADIRFWAIEFLLFFGVLIVAKIVILIVFSILNSIATQDMPPKKLDERDTMIGLKAMRSAYWVFGFGVILAAASQAVGLDVRYLFLTTISAALISDTVSSVLAFRWYRRGL